MASRAGELFQPKCKSFNIQQRLDFRQIISNLQTGNMSNREGSEGSVAMEEDQDDDLYGANGAAARSNGQEADTNVQDAEDDEEEEEDSDDVMIILYPPQNLLTNMFRISRSSQSGQRSPR